ncbi:unnamed protein product, partial [Polarella glacialis]
AEPPMPADEQICGQEDGAPGISSPLGVWSEADLRQLPRFPQQDSFPVAKGLIKRYLQQDDISLQPLPSYRDLRI